MRQVGVRAPIAVTRHVGAEAEVAVVVVTHNSADTIAGMLAALPDALADVDTAEVIIVDNQSSDRTLAIVQEQSPWATVVEAGGNVGYGAGINVGLRERSPAQGVLVLNPDTRPAPGSIAALRDAAERDHAVGITVPRLVDDDGRLSFSLRREPTIPRAFGEAMLGGRISGRFAQLGETIRSAEYYRRATIADWATGAAMYISRRALDEVAEWPEEYFLYSEETHYALAVRDAGLKLQFVPHATVVHRGGDMANSPWLWSLRATNRVRQYRNRHGQTSTAVFRCAVTLHEAVRLITGRATHRAALRALLTGRLDHPAPSPAPR